MLRARGAGIVNYGVQFSVVMGASINQYSRTINVQMPGEQGQWNILYGWSRIVEIRHITP